MKYQEKTKVKYTRRQKIDYYKSRIAKAQIRLSKLENMTDEEHDQDWESDLSKQLVKKLKGRKSITPSELITLIQLIKKS